MPATAYTYHHHRSGSASKRIAFKTTPRPGLPKSYSSGRLSKTTASASSKPSDSLVDDGDMIPTGFHQFCATCERQIAIPNSSVLYCSERCRRHDAHSSSVPATPVAVANAAANTAGRRESTATSSGSPSRSLSNSTSTTPPSPSPLSEYEAFIGRPILARRKLAHLLNGVQVLHDGKADMDPTEWKPDAITSLPVGGVITSSGGNVTDLQLRVTADGGSAVTDPCSSANDTSYKAAVATATVSSSVSSGTIHSGSTTATDEPNAHAHETVKMQRTPSDAYLYLSQFHRSSESFASLSQSSSGRRSRMAASRSSSQRRFMSFTTESYNSSSSSSLDSDSSSSGDEEASPAGTPTTVHAATVPSEVSSRAPSIVISSVLEDGQRCDDDAESVSLAGHRVQGPDACMVPDGTAYPKMPVSAIILPGGQTASTPALAGPIDAGSLSRLLKEQRGR